jgi:UDP-N-acetylmuramyl pentapeptide phosphotransferase/UDP-N-acetylglucosamine-1-phosphate transferase
MPLLLQLCNKFRLYDIPDERKIHTTRVPRLGGVVFLPSQLVSVAISLVLLTVSGVNEVVSLKVWTFLFLIGLFLIYLIGVFDDLLSLAASKKFVIQLASSCCFPISGLYINTLHGFMGIYEIPFWAGAILTVIVSTTIVNAINLIDGIDGLSSLLCIISFALLGIRFYDMGIEIYTLYTIGLIGGILPFLYYNIYGKPEKGTKIFMGDTGSLTLGYSLSFLCLKYVMDNPPVIDPTRFDALVLPTSLLIVPVFDVLRVFFYRIRHHRGIFSPDKNHIHHKFMRMGCTPHQTLGWVLLIHVFFIAYNYLTVGYIGVTCMVFSDIVIWTLLHLYLDHRLAKVEKND